MATCEPFHDQLLDFVYGLLDEAEAQALRTHLEVCPRCGEALTEVHGQQHLFARAALPVAPDQVPAFAPPGPAEVDGPLPVTLPLAAAAPAAAPAVRRRSLRPWFAGAAAATVLVAAGVLWHVYQQGHDALQAAIVTQDRADRALAARPANLESNFKADAQALERGVRAEAPLHLYVMGPTQLQPGGGEVVQVATHDLDGQPVSAKVTVSLVEPATGEVLSRRAAVAAGGNAAVPLGDDLGKVLHGHAEVQLVAEAEAGPAKARVRQMLKVAAPTYVTHLITDKTVYRPGQLLFFRALVLDRAGLTPPAGSVALHFALVNAAGKTIADTTVPTGAGGIAAGELAVADQWADGAYELRVRAAAPGAVQVQPHARKLRIARNLAGELLTDRNLYKPGDIVNLGLLPPLSQDPKSKVAMATAAATPPMSVELSLDGRPVPLLNNTPGSFGAYGGFAGGMGGFNPNGPPAQLPTLPKIAPSPGQPPPPMAPPADVSQPPVPQVVPFGQAGSLLQGNGVNAGKAYALIEKGKLQLALPSDLTTSRVRVKVVLTKGKYRETYEQELAIAPAGVAVDLFPEGGDLVAGVPNRVYYRVRAPQGGPVHLDGRVIVLSKSDVLFDSAPGASAGSFTFTPQVGETYTVRVTTPGGPIQESAEPFARLGGVRAGGVVLHVPQPVAAEGEPLEVVLRNPGPPRRVLLVAQCRGRCLAQQWVEVKGAAVHVALGTLPGGCGLVRLTAYQAGGDVLRPLAERLIYRSPARQLDLTVLHLGGVVSPGLGQKSVQLEFRARDEDRQPASAWLLAAVVDERFRGREPSPLAHFFIAGDVKSGADLDDAVLLAADRPQTRHGLDLFLGTAGWRRFEAQAQGVATATDGAFFGRENASPQTLRERSKTKLDAALAPARAALQQKLAELGQARTAVRAELARARAELRDYEALPEQYLRLGLGLATLLLLAGAALALTAGLWRLVRHHSATPLFAGAFACLGLCLLATLLLATLEPSPQTNALAQAAPLGDAPLPPGPDAGLHLFAAPAADAPPIGQFTVASLGREAGAKTVLRSSDEEAKKPDRLVRQFDEPQGDKLTANFFYRGLAQNGPPPMKHLSGKGKAHGPGPHPEFAKRYDLALERQALRHDKDSKAQPSTAPTGGGPGGLARPESPAEVQPKSAPFRRVYVYEPGLQSETLLWHPDLYLPNGSAQVAFDVPASASTYRVLLFGHTADGRLGFYEGHLEVQPEPGR